MGLASRAPVLSRSAREPVTPVPPPVSSEVRDRMRATLRQDTPAELALRSALHRRGLRFRVQRVIAGLPRVRPDIVFVSARLVVFVDGCFWHRCPDHGTDPKANAEWWRAKLDRNAERDRQVAQQLEDLGWQVIRVWAHENPPEAADRVARIVRSLSPRR